MCVVSMVSDFYNDKNFPQQAPDWLQPMKPMPWPQTAPSTLPWTQDSFKLLQEIMEKMKQLDEKLGLANCEDPKKAEWMKSIEDRLARLEKGKGRKAVVK